MTGRFSDTSDIALRELRFAWPNTRFGLSVAAFDIAPGERVMLTGASGSGKSTLLSLICGALTPQTGAICIAGHDIVPLRSRARDRVRADHLGIVFQQFNLLPYASALDNILLPLRFSAARRARVPNPTQEALALAGALGLGTAQVRQGTAAQLSVGQQQRVAVARALIGRPDVVIADEPTSALDPDTQDDFMSLMFAQLNATDASLLMVSHDPGLARWFDRVVPLADLLMPESAR